MALSKADIKAAYPLPVYNYRVEVDGATIAFSEVSGLSIGFDTTVYKESPSQGGAPGPRVMRMPAQLKDTTVTLKKGLVRQASIAAFYGWISQTALNQTTKKNVVVRLCDEKGDAVISWSVLNAFPTKLDAPSFDAKSNDVAVESLELMADGIQIEEA